MKNEPEVLTMKFIGEAVRYEPLNDTPFARLTANLKQHIEEAFKQHVYDAVYKAWEKDGIERAASIALAFGYEIGVELVPNK